MGSCPISVLLPGLATSQYRPRSGSITRCASDSRRSGRFTGRNALPSGLAGRSDRLGVHLVDRVAQPVHGHVQADAEEMLMMGGKGLRRDQSTEIAGFAGRRALVSTMPVSFASNSMLPSW